ncbi:MAG: amidohydrolase family protein [Sedimentisphaerales bacterium]|nr:amidohydrolase family protein [Sedimentisphaerales bacterium]
MIIDAHAHVLLWPKMLPAPNTTTFMSVEQQLAIMEAKGIDKTIILPIVSPEPLHIEPQSIGEVLEICERYPGRFIPFCNLDPRLGKRPENTTAADFEFVLKQFKDLGCKGIGEMTARVYWDDPQLWCLFEAAEKLDLPITFHTTTPDCDSYGILDEIGLHRLEKTLARFKKLKFFGHSQDFWNEMSGDVQAKDKNGYPKGKVQPGGRLPELLRKYPNLYGDLSAGSGLNALQRDPEHGYKFIDEFQDRLVLGLDYCSVKNDMQHIEWLTEIKEQGQISEQAYEKIMWRNINRLIDLGLE